MVGWAVGGIGAFASSLGVAGSLVAASTLGGLATGILMAAEQVYEFSPNKDLDQKRRYYLAGPEWSILQHSSLLKAGHDILGDRLGFTIDFEKWFEDFEYEFPKKSIQYKANIR